MMTVSTDWKRPMKLCQSKFCCRCIFGNEWTPHLVSGVKGHRQRNLSLFTGNNVFSRREAKIVFLNESLFSITQAQVKPSVHCWFKCDTCSTVRSELTCPAGSSSWLLPPGNASPLPAQTHTECRSNIFSFSSISFTYTSNQAGVSIHH